MPIQIERPAVERHRGDRVSQTVLGVSRWRVRNSGSANCIPFLLAILLPICATAAAESSAGADSPQHLLQTMQDESSDMEERVKAARAYWDQTGSAEQVLPVLIEGLNTYSSAHTLAAWALGAMGPSARPATEELIDWLDRSFYAPGALQEIGGLTLDHVEPIRDELQRARLNLRDGIVPLLDGLIGDRLELARRHIRALRGDHVADHIWATDFMIRAGPQDAAAVPLLIEALEEDHVDVKGWAALCLLKIGPSAKQAIPALLRLQEDPDPGLRWRAAMALRAVRHDPPPVPDEALQTHLQQDYVLFGLVAMLAALLVGLVTYRACASVRRGERRLRQAGWIGASVTGFLMLVGIGYVAILASQRANPLPIGSALFRLQHGDKRVRARAAYELSWESPSRTGEPLLVALEQGLIDDETYPAARDNAFSTLSGHWDSLPRDRVARLYVDGLRAKDGQLRERCARYLLVHFGDYDSTVPTLTVALQDPEAAEAAAESLKVIGDPAATAALEEADVAVIEPLSD